MTNFLTEQEQNTINFYNAQSQKWADGHNTERFWGESVDAFQELLADGKVIEIGCGGGRDAKELVAMGYDYTGTDISEGFLEVARQALPDQNFFQASVYDLSNLVEDALFDGFWCSAVLLHIPKDRIDEALNSIKKVVREGGIGFISIKEGSDDVIKKEGDLERNFYMYQDDEFREVLARNSIEVMNFRYMPMNERTKWLIYVVRIA